MGSKIVTRMIELASAKHYLRQAVYQDKFDAV